MKSALCYNFIRNSVVMDNDKSNIKEPYYHVSVDSESVAKVDFNNNCKYSLWQSLAKSIITIPIFIFLFLVVLPISFLFTNSLVEKILGEGNKLTGFGSEVDLFGTKILAVICEFREGSFKF